MASDNRKVDYLKNKNSNDVDDDDIEMLNDDIEGEEEVQISIAELIGTLFKTHKTFSLPIA